jgi:hypothetical protein
MNESRYLQNALGVAVQTIYDMRASCEVDTTRIDPSDIARELPANTKRLQSQAGVHLEPSLPPSPPAFTLSASQVQSKLDHYSCGMGIRAPLDRSRARTAAMSLLPSERGLACTLMLMRR